jgi:hypothetical protein
MWAHRCLPVPGEVQGRGDMRFELHEKSALLRGLYCPFSNLTWPYVFSPSLCRELAWHFLWATLLDFTRITLKFQKSVGSVLIPPIPNISTEVEFYLPFLPGSFMSFSEALHLLIFSIISICLLILNHLMLMFVLISSSRQGGLLSLQ